MEEFLKARGVDTNIFKDEKIDEDCVKIMTDEELTKFLPAYGDRLALKQFFHKESDKQKIKKQSLFETLRIKLKSVSDQNETPSKKKSSQALKPEKTVGMGIMIYNEDEQRFHTVRTKNGGGNRNLSICKLAKKNDIIKSATELFFPNGKSPKFGDAEDYTFDIMDFQYIPLDENVTVDRVSEITKLANLRFYLALRHKYPKIEAKKCSKRKSKASATKTKAETERNEEEKGETSIYELPVLRSKKNKIGEVTKIQTGEQLNMDAFDTLDALSSSPRSPFSESLPDINSDISEFLQNLEKEESTEVRSMGLNNTVLPVHQHIKVHRGHIFTEVRNIFKEGKSDILNDTFTFEIILPNGEPEIAEDGGGVLRDVLVEFWNSFFEECALGRDSKVPILRHDFSETDWKAVASILFFGWHHQKYFPIQLSKAFISCWIFGMDTYSNSSNSLISEYLSYLGESESKIIRSALDQDDKYDDEDIIDVLGSHDCRSIPNKDNIKQIVGEIAHKELIQQPMYVKECWFNQLHYLGFTLGDSTLDGIYDSLRATNKKVLNMLKFPDMNPIQTITANLLKKYVRDLPCDMLSNFLRFCTGSDNIILNHAGYAKEIGITFNSLRGLSRRPVGHTCGMVLELPTEYESFLEFRSEFNKVLKSDVWVMDFV